MLIVEAEGLVSKTKAAEREQSTYFKMRTQLNKLFKSISIDNY